MWIQVCILLKIMIRIYPDVDHTYAQWIGLEILINLLIRSIKICTLSQKL